MSNEKQRKEEETLIRAAQNGDKRAYEVLIRKYQRQVVNTAYLMMGSREAAEDIAQEVFIKIYHKLSQYTPETSFYAWVYRMTTNTCIDEIRKKKLYKFISLDFLTEDGLESISPKKEQTPPVSEFQEDERNEVVRKALQLLKPEHREVLVLREYDNFGYNEIAEALGISVAAVKSRIFRARSELRDVLLKHFRNEL